MPVVPTANGVVSKSACLQFESPGVEGTGDMLHKSVLKDWIIESLNELGGSASVVEVCRSVWSHHEEELRASGDLFYTWQYDIR